MRESRLFKILYYLLDKGTATAPELAGRLEVSVRTIYRDIDVLSGAGIPIYAETGRKGGIRLLGGFVLDKTVLSEQERREVLSALQGLEAVGGADQGETLQKLSALFRVEAFDWLEIDFSRWGSKPRDNEKFETLKDAVIHRQCVRILYVGAYGKEDWRVVRPLKLYYKSKDWYLKAYCTKRQGFRLFKLNRILSWELQEEHFLPMTFPKEQDTASGECDVILRFPREEAYRVYDEFDLTQIRKEENGDLTVTADMPQDDWLVGYLLSFGPQVEVIEPRYLREILAARAMEIYKKNKA